MPRRSKFAIYDGKVTNKRAKYKRKARFSFYSRARGTSASPKLRKVESKTKEIRNSTAEFLIFQIEGKEQGIEVFYKDKTVWCTQKAMGMLFDCTSDNISVHLQNIYDTDELKKEATTEKISVVRREGNRDVNRTLQFYNLDAIISV